MPYTDQVTVGYERQLAGNMAISADYVHAFSRDLLMSMDLNPGLRATTDVDVAAGAAAQRRSWRSGRRSCRPSTRASRRSRPP